MTIAMTGEDGISYSDYFDAALETVYVKEITAPNGYAINKTVYPVHVSAGSSVEVEAVNTSVKGKITVKKQDGGYGRFPSAGRCKTGRCCLRAVCERRYPETRWNWSFIQSRKPIQEKTLGRAEQCLRMYTLEQCM